MSDSSYPDPIIANYVTTTTTSSPLDDVLRKDTGVHFLTEQMPKLAPKPQGNKDDGKDGTRGKYELLEYLLKNDGRVICKMCGEVLQSRTHWYRHKYKRHAAPPTNPAPLFQCEQCFGYFKSRKGYIGHVATRHGELSSDTSPVSTNTQPEVIVTENVQPVVVQEAKDETDPELAIPKSSVPKYQAIAPKPAKPTETKKAYFRKEPLENKANWDDKRSKEEKMVADIIDRVRRECEAQPGPTSARRVNARRAPTVIQQMRQTDALT